VPISDRSANVIDGMLSFFRLIYDDWIANMASVISL